jgi:HK97 family phage major capsid protein
MTDMTEVKRLVEEQGEAWGEFKRTNEEMLKAKADGKAVSDLEAKLNNISADLDKKADKLKELQDAITAATSPGAQSKGDDNLQTELKQFNQHMRADYQAKGKSVDADMATEQYREYKSGFLKLAAGVKFEQLSEGERKAMSAGSDPDGGYLLPASTSGAIVGKVYEQSIMRQLATVQTISTGKIEGIVDNDEASAGWVSEIGARNETNTPIVGKWEIEAHEMYASPKVTQKLLDDAAVDIEAWLAAKVADKIARVEGAAFWQGTGVGQPKGLAAYTTVATSDATRAWGQLEHVNTGANGTFHTTQFDPVVTLMGALKDQYLSNASFVMTRAVRTAARSLKESTTNRYLWEPGMQQGAPERLMGYPVRVDEYMPALATGSLSLAFGDFRAAYLIVDRIGIRTLRDPFTAKPYIVFYTTKRTGGGAVNFEAVKFLRFSAS